MAPGPGGILFVSIPTPSGSILAALDADGAYRPGWPIALEDSCTHLMALDDGSVRAVCDTPGFEEPQAAHAYAFDASAHPLAGWPVQLGSDRRLAGRMIGNDLVIVVGRYGNDPKVSMQIVAPDGAIRRGVEIAQECCYRWEIANDGIAYRTFSVSEAPNSSRLTAMGPDGELAGWPVQLEGRASDPTIVPGGRIVVAVGPPDGGSTGVLAFGRGGNAASASADVPITTVNPLGTGDVDCGTGFVPRTPIVGPDGTIFVYSELDNRVLALDPSLAVRQGWPFRPATGLEYRYYEDPRSEISCGSLALPAVGPDSTLYMPLQARDDSAGGSLVGLSRDGKMRAGWPVGLRRPRAEFWSVVVGGDGTVYALALEPESGNTWSSSILAIAPDSTVRYTTTIVEP